MVANDREAMMSVESSPVMGVKRGAEEKKRSSQLKSAAVEPLTDIEEGFIRSLSRCVPWAARGGKSGSTFCKTTGKCFSIMYFKLNFRLLSASPISRKSV